jgi:hypothetical protein
LALRGAILYPQRTTEEEMSTEDRRAPGATRIPFDVLVEVGGALGPSFEAQAVNVSEEGIQLRTAYLPEPGQPLTCRFEGGPGRSILASGEVVWAHGEATGGEFGVRFTDMDSESVEALKRICGVGLPPPQVQAGSKVRLHIEGLASPMRAKIKDAHPTAVTVGSELGFLQVGKQLELEDAQSGGKRAACIDRVDVAVDPSSHVPQLVVTLRYADAPAEADAGRAESPAQASVEAKAPAAIDDLSAVDEASTKMKGALARNIARIGPAFERLAKRAKTTAALMAKRRGERMDDGAPRRTTAPPPGGGLHTVGRRVVRGDSAPEIEPGPAPSTFKVTKRKAIVAGAVMTAAVLGAIGLKKMHHEAGQEGAPATEMASPSSATPAYGASEGAGTSGTAMAAASPPSEPAGSPATPAMGAIAASDEPPATSSGSAHKRHGKVAPFGNGPVHHGNVMHLKMDGPIEALEGAQQPTGFAVKVPGRKSLEAAGPLAARDSRIAAIKIANDPAGAELTVAFKDGVPNYQVTARGDTLTIALAPEGAVEKMAKKDEKGRVPKHGNEHVHEHGRAHGHGQGQGQGEQKI